MSLTVKQRVEAFQLEWGMRLYLLKAGGFSDEAIAHHRKEILHNYQLTEEQAQEKEES